MTALGGSFYAQFIRFINPERNMGTELSIDMALMSIIGGQGTVFGPLVGALFLAPVRSSRAPTSAASSSGCTWRSTDWC